MQPFKSRVSRETALIFRVIEQWLSSKQFDESHNSYFDDAEKQIDTYVGLTKVQGDSSLPCHSGEEA